MSYLKGRQMEPQEYRNKPSAIYRNSQAGGQDLWRSPIHGRRGVAITVMRSVITSEINIFYLVSWSMNFLYPLFFLARGERAKMQIIWVANKTQQLTGCFVSCCPQSHGRTSALATALRSWAEQPCLCFGNCGLDRTLQEQTAIPGVEESPVTSKPGLD